MKLKLTITLSAFLALQVLAHPLPKSIKERDVDLTAYGAANMRGEVGEKRNNLDVYGAAAQKTHTTV